MCGAFTPHCGYKNSTNILIGACIVQLESVRVNFACTNRLFNLSAEAIINVSNVRLYARCAIFNLKIIQILFSCDLAKGFHF